MNPHLHPPELPACEAPARTPSPWLDLLLATVGEHRLHPALILASQHRLPPVDILELRWVDVDLTGHRIRTHSGFHDIGAGMSALLYWHGCRQRHDRRMAETAWEPGLRVFVDELGHSFTEARADEVISDLARSAGLPPLTLGALRHPCLTGP